eukprot:TRINITY_DN2723_c0_g1_i1.p1 TRINITY_DN2723_c0_g1~~TRINITY_DN2723_c0_g1_i1.p1  ORF type:complete len:70 (+),score=5.85 TRINITY_DN2723_c0_g1_i1:153-362(+)
MLLHIRKKHHNLGHILQSLTCELIDFLSCIFKKLIDLSKFGDDIMKSLNRLQFNQRVANTLYFILRPCF